MNSDEVKQSFAARAAVVILLAYMAVLAGGAARHESVTIDEVAHIGAGVSYLQKFDLRMNEEHPPLAKVISALPLVVRGVHADYTSKPWTFSNSTMLGQYLGEWVFGHMFLMSWNNPFSTLWWARVPMLLLTLLLGAVLFRYGSQLGGPWGGLLCLCAFVTMPAFLAFGPLVLTDIAVTFFSVLTIWQLPNLWRSPSLGTIVKFGLVFAGSLLTKFSSGLFFFVFLAMVLSLRIWQLPEQPTERYELRRWRRRAWWNFALGTLCAAFFVYLTYFILSWNEPTDSFSVIPHFPASPLLRRVLMPPWIFLRGLLGFAMMARRPAYLFGHTYPHGTWFYFPVVFGLKSQLALLILILLAVAVAFVVKARGRSVAAAVPEGMSFHWRALWISLLVFAGACMLSPLQISIRHFTIPIVVITLMMAPLPRMLTSLRSSGARWASAGSWATAALCLVLIVGGIRAYPNYFSFVNALGMGKPGYLLVNDSNLDWNHALPQVEAFVQNHGLNQILLDAYGFSEPGAWVPQAQKWECQKAQPSDGGRWAVVSANDILDSSNCGWLMQYPHQSIANGSMYAVQLPAVIPAAGMPGGPPLPDQYRYLAGMPFDAREIFTTCIENPDQLQTVWDKMMALGKEYQAQEKKKRNH